MKYLPRVLPYLRPYSKLAWLSGVVIVVSGLVGLLLPWSLQIVVDNVLGGQPVNSKLAALLGPLAATPGWLLLTAVIGGLLIGLISNGLTVLGSYINTSLEQGMVLDIRSDLFQHAQRLSLAFHDQRRSGGLIFAINGQADAAARLVMMFPPLAESLITLVGMLWIVFRIDPWLSLLSLTVMPLLYFSVGYYMTHIHSRLTRVRAMEGESLSIVHEAISMLRVIVAFGREDHEHRRFRDQGQSAVVERVKLTVQQTLFTLAVNTATAIGTALVLGFGAYRALQGSITVGELLVVLAYIASVYRPLEAISTTIGSMQEVFVTLKIAFDLLDTDPEIKDDPAARPLPGRAHGRVGFDHVSFSYTGRQDTLVDISFDARPGQVVGIVGPTGAGKSTLISLIPRFYTPSSGTILIDGRDIRSITLKSLREQISMVLQEPLLFSGSIADNIRYGRLDATMEEVVEAAKNANAHDFIERLPRKYDTTIGERGATLSGGERQRISVARAFLRDAPILILDEPTSAIDSRTEAVILDALDRLMAGRTTFMIAHRLSTLRHADQILVIDKGVLVERGTHDELMARGGMYRQLYELQNRHSRRVQEFQSDAAAIPGALEPGAVGLAAEPT
jgi:ATP-binding cassette, subfamily B, bacterial